MPPRAHRPAAQSRSKRTAPAAPRTSRTQKRSGAQPPALPAGLRSELLSWFDAHRRELPWRRTKDAYAIWLSEVMLQQTQVAVVIPYWQRFLERLPTVQALARAELSEVLGAWKGLGYYTRARNLHRAAQQMLERHGGRVPDTHAELLALPGFGRYTAGAVASIAFGLPTPLVDGNVARLFARLFEVEGPPGDREREERLWALAEALVQGERPGDLNQALMELGATVCRPEAPTCLLCPVRRHCRALAHGRVDELPPPKERRPLKALTLALAVWRRGEHVLLARREERGLFGGLWELPSVELSGAGDPAPLLSAALGVAITLGPPSGEVQRTLTHRALTLRLYPITGGTPPSARAPGYRELAWVTPGEASALGMSTAMALALKRALATDGGPGEG
ncbi:MAG: A/G-specific adenine glycosylase [Myxococcaceae bacterium]|nr:A/G-specific adenine glycosylase [Myxococcaceae bacterium]